MSHDDLKNLLGSLSPEKREQMIRAANGFMQTREGQNLMRALSADPSLGKKLKEAEAKGISRLSAKDRARLLSALSQSPAVRETLKKKEGRHE